MASLLEDIEDIIGSHDGSCDSGIQASPQASLFQPNYGKQARTRKYKSCYSRNVMENKFFYLASSVGYCYLILPKENTSQCRFAAVLSQITFPT